MDENRPRPSWRRALALTLALAAAIEAVTLFLRFGLGLTAAENAPEFERRLLGGLRIHHGVVGALILVAAALMARWSEKWARRAAILGGALLLSDLVHHFLVLWPLTGSHQFDIYFPR